MVDIFISLNVSSMKESALHLKNYLESKGLSVWICVDLLGGENYRDEIIKALKSCSVMILLINEEWALSGECQDEYALAKRLNLTSHESGRSKRENPRKPCFIPIAFPNLNWTSHSHVELLAASTNFITHNNNSLLNGNAQQTLNTVALSLKHLGFKMQIDAIEPTTVPNLLVPSEINTTKQAHITVQQQFEETSVLLQALSASIQQLNFSFKENKVTPASRISEEKVEIKVENKLKKEARYLGTSCVSGVVSNFKWANWDSKELLITEYDEKSNKFKANLTSTELRKDFVDPPTAVPQYLKDWASNLEEAILHCSGTFDPTLQLLQFKPDRIEYIKKNSKGEWTLRKYYVILHKNLLFGIAFDDQNNLQTFVLQQF